MAGNNVKVKGQVDLSVNVQTENARQQLIGLQKELTHISNLQTNIGATQLFDPNLQEVIMGASKAALELKSHLAAATNVDTGKLDFSKFAKNLDVDLVLFDNVWHREDNITSEFVHFSKEEYNRDFNNFIFVWRKAGGFQIKNYKFAM